MGSWSWLHIKNYLRGSGGRGKGKEGKRKGEREREADRERQTDRDRDRNTVRDMTLIHQSDLCFLKDTVRVHMEQK